MSLLSKTNGMLKALKDWFVAHEGNDHKPHLLRSKALVAILILVLGIEGVALMRGSTTVSHFGFLGDITVSLLTRETNLNRANSNLSSLAVSPALEEAARLKAEDMARKSYFAHNSPEGLTPWYWFAEANYEFAYAGENLAVNFTDSKEVVDAWMNSPGHRANILNNNFREIGIATANGMYEGKSVVFVVQMFGTPAARRAKPIAKPVTIAVKPVPSIVATTTTTTTRDMFVAVRGVEIDASSSATGTTIAGESDVVPPQNNLLQNALRPDRTAKGLILAISLLLAAVLLAKLTRVGLIHRGLVANGVMTLVLMAALAFLNQHLLSSFTRII